MPFHWNGAKCGSLGKNMNSKFLPGEEVANCFDGRTFSRFWSSSKLNYERSLRKLKMGTSSASQLLQNFHSSFNIVSHRFT